MDSDSFGWKAFAGIMILVAGTFNVIDGLIGLSNVRYFSDVTPGVGTTEYPIVNDIKVWSWVVLGAGIVLIAAAFAIFYGTMWGRVIGVIAAAVNMIIQFTYLGHYPFWSLSMMVLDGFVIYALTAKGAPVQDPYTTSAGQVSVDLSQPTGDPRQPAPAPGMSPQQPATH
jgi:hypothetical protein